VTDSLEHPDHAGSDAQHAALPGSRGEHLLQQLFNTGDRAAAFYDKQVLDHLNLRMREFIARQEMAFVATSDTSGECDCTFRAGPPGFIRTLGERMLAYPEFRGNGVLASLGNILENRHIGILMVDFFDDLVGLHINGKAEILSTSVMTDRHGVTDPETAAGRRAERWVAVTVEEAYIHCSKHIPLLAKEDRRQRVSEGRVRPAGSDYFTGERPGAVRDEQPYWQSAR
jgi:predicted pyridoxine 5'-phosphate oxidase superfamily flavin-nucleotide-binding protein